MQHSGLRQCLAHFLSKLRRVDSCKSCDHHVLGSIRTCYVVNVEIVEQLHSLVNDGNVDRYMYECTFSITIYCKWFVYCGLLSSVSIFHTHTHTHTHTHSHTHTHKHTHRGAPAPMPWFRLWAGIQSSPH